MSRTFFAITEQQRGLGEIQRIEPLPLPKPAPVKAPAPKAPVPQSEMRPARPVEKPAEDALMDDSSIPYIEVGGPRTATSIPPAPPTPVARSAPPVVAPVAAPVVVPPAPIPVPIIEDRLEFPSKAIRLLNVSFQAMPEARQYGPSAAQIGADVVAYHQPSHPVSGQYRLLQQQIAAQLPKADRAMIVLTSAKGGAGASTAALNIAISRAFDNRGRVLLLDAHPGQPTLASRIGCSDQPGLSELLVQASPLGLALQPTELPNLQLLAWGRAEKHLGDSAWATLPAIIARLMQRFEWIIVDAPHQIEGLKRWVGLTDGIYMVVRQDEWDSPLIDQASDAIRTIGGKIRGCLMTAA